MYTPTNMVNLTDSLILVNNFKLSPFIDFYTTSFCLQKVDLGRIFSQIEQVDYKEETELIKAARRIYSEYKNNEEFTVFTTLDRNKQP